MMKEAVNDEDVLYQILAKINININICNYLINIQCPSSLPPKENQRNYLYKKSSVPRHLKR